MRRLTGIYQIQSKVKLERIYIGSAINIDIRWRTHLQTLRNNKHHNPKLQNHFNKYGIDDLQFSVLLGCEKEDLLRYEQFFIDSYNPWFNTLLIAGSPTGHKHSEETKKKLSLASKGKPKSIEHRKNMSHPMSEETKAKLRGPISEDRKKKLIGRNHIIGYKHTDIGKVKMSIWQKGKKKKPLTKETKKKLSDSIKKHWELRRLKYA